MKLRRCRHHVHIEKWTGSTETIPGANVVKKKLACDLVYNTYYIPFIIAKQV